MDETVERSPHATYNRHSAPLPPFDKALWTRTWCIVGLGLCYILSIAFICTGSVLYSRNGYQPSYCGGYGPSKKPYYRARGLRTKTGAEVSTLALNLSVTLATEFVGYIHATSLRWSLYHEDRLRHNSNLRLFTSAKHSMPNRWFVNAVWLIAITVSYSCASQLPIVTSLADNAVFTPPAELRNQAVTDINLLSLLILGCCIFLLSLLATWTLVPQLLVCLILIASITTWTFTNREDTSFISESWKDDIAPSGENSKWPLYLVNLKDSCEDSRSPRIIAINILFVSALQLLYTTALHVAEQFANLHRDERAWRHASIFSSKKGGALIGRDASKAAVTACPTVFLFAMKPMCHWIFGLSFPIDAESQSVIYHPLPLFTLTAMEFLLASFATYVALRQPAGPQPSAFGNVERLLGMIDDWGKGAGHRIFWGEKRGHRDGMEARCVGTSGEMGDLSEVEVDGRPYLGMKEDEVRGKGVKRTRQWCC